MRARIHATVSNVKVKFHGAWLGKYSSIPNDNFYVHLSASVISFDSIPVPRQCEFKWSNSSLSLSSPFAVLELSRYTPALYVFFAIRYSFTCVSVWEEFLVDRPCFLLRTICSFPIYLVIHKIIIMVFISEGFCTLVHCAHRLPTKSMRPVNSNLMTSSSFVECKCLVINVYR